MRTKFSILIFFLVSLPIYLLGQLSPFIHIDQFGYSIMAEKVAVLSNPKTGYNAALSYTPGATLQVVDAFSQAVVFEASPSVWASGAEHALSGDEGWWFDFSALQTAGTYYISDATNNEKSGLFNINENPYDNILKAATKMFYYNRCNTEKVQPYAAANWIDGTNFLNPLQDANCRFYLEPNNVSKEKELAGGWFDAGDYNKYVNYLPNTIGPLLSAYEDNPSIFSDDWNIPESGNGISDLLDEVKYELDWVYKMSNTDGSVHIKLGSISFSQNASSPPSLNTDPRYYGHTCTSASLSTALIFAHAAKVFFGIGESAYAQSLQDRAIACFDYARTFIDNGNLEIECDDATINASDSDKTVDEQMDLAVSASVYLFELTNDPVYNAFFLQYYASTEPISSAYWSPYKLELYDALFLYTTLNGANSAASNDILNKAQIALNNNSSDFFQFADDELYRSKAPNWMYHWGSNSPISNLANLCLLFKKYNINPSANAGLQRKADEHVHYFHGVNPQGLVYLTNMYEYGGDRCVDEMYHTWFADGSPFDNAKTSEFGPAPGYLVGGPNSSYTPEPGIILDPPMNQPEMKSYKDFNDNFPNNSWQISEPAIYYQAAYIRMLANQVNSTVVNSIPDLVASSNCVTLYPNPSSGYFEIKGLLANYNIQILDSLGVEYANYTVEGSHLVIDINALPTGLFFVHVENLNNSEICIQQIVKE